MNGVRLSPDERAAIRRYFVKALSSLQSMDLYYCPTRRFILVRSPAAMKRHPLPDDATLVGSYAHPFGGDDFLEDLDALLVRVAVAMEQEGRRRGNTGTPAFA